MTEPLKVGMRVMVSTSDRPELNSEGFILIGPAHRDGRDIFHVHMGDHDNRFPAGWLRPLDQGDAG